MNERFLSKEVIQSENLLYTNVNGYKYKKGVLDKALNEFKKLVEKGEAYGYFEKDNHFKTWEEETSSHKILKFNRLDDNRYEIKLAILDNEKGKALKHLFDKQNIQPNMHQICELDGDNNKIVSSVSSIPYINLTPRKDNSKKNE